MTFLWVPEAARPGFVCRVCHAEFAKGDVSAYERHVVRCGEEHHDRLVAQTGELRRFNEPLDPEWEAYNAALRAAGIDPEEQYSRGRKSNIRRASES